MLTSRGWWFFLGIVALLPLSLGLGARPLTLTLLTLFGWFLLSWLSFLVRLRLAWRRLRVQRTLLDAHGPIHSTWAGHAVRVQGLLTSDSVASLPFVIAVDRVPFLAQLRQGEAYHVEGSLGKNQPLEVTYWIDCPSAGTLRFAGLKLHLVDLHGLFYQVGFVPDVRTYRVLPALADAKGRVPAAKRINLLPLLGTHPHRRAGSGSELLDLRDYEPGDPPKLIAWKLSARRDKLITKVFESEVPIRCTMFVDQSDAVRVGQPGANGLARLIEIASAVLQAGVGARDLVGLTMFDEEGLSHQIRPARGRPHLVQALRALASAADLQPRANPVPMTRLLPLGYALAYDMYPDQLSPENNAFPFWLPWIFPQPAYTLSRPPRPKGSWPRRALAWVGQRWRESPFGPSAMGGYPWSPRYHRFYRYRKQLAAILSVHNHLDPGGLGLLLEDDDAFRHYLLRFLAEHQVAYPLSFYDAAGRYAFGSPKKITILADALTGAVFRGRDDELFVLLVDLLEARGPELEHLLRAIRVARARHHQVMIVQPWPQGLPLPERKSGPQDPQKLPPSPRSLQEFLFQTYALRMHQAYAHVQSVCAAAGAPVIVAAHQDTVPLILRRIERLRLLQRGVG